MFSAKKISLMLPATWKVKLKPYYERMTPLIDRVDIGTKIIFGRARRLIHPSRLPEADEGVLVNLGCGMSNHPKFINVDGYPHPHVHFVHRIDRLPMFSDGSADLIYASHCLEHFKYRDIDRVLSEWARVLKPGGVLRLSVPDFDKLMVIYSDTRNPDDFIEQLMGGQNNRYNFHYVLFNKMNLVNYLARAGFVDIKEWIPGSNDLTTFGDFSVYQKEIKGMKYEISLNIEARKG